MLVKVEPEKLTVETAKANNLWLGDYLVSVLSEHAEQSKGFEINDLLPWSEKRRRGFGQCECRGPRFFCIGGLLSAYV